MSHCIWNQLDEFYQISTKNEIFFSFLATGGASEHFWALSCMYLESAWRVLSNKHEKSGFYFFRFWPLVALVSIFGHPHTYIWNQLDEFYQMSTKNRDSIYFRFWPLVALVSILGHPHAYIRNQLDEFYLMSTNKIEIFHGIGVFLYKRSFSKHKSSYLPPGNAPQPFPTTFNWLQMMFATF